MNKVITINLNGVAYQLEEGGYDALRAYLDQAARRLEGNPDKDEIITDIEQAIADKFRALLGAHKTVVSTREVTGVITEMGPVEGSPTETAEQEKSATGGAPAGAADAGRGDQAGPMPRRLYRIPEGAMLAGVCNGVAAYLNLDVTIVRLLFTLLTFLWGAGALVYLVMAVIVPEARTPAEKTAATGAAATAQEFIKRARDGYYEGMKSFHDRESRRAWKRKFKRDMRGWKYNFQREMHANTHQWQQPWQQNWAAHPPSVFGAVFIAPVLSLLLFALVVVLLYSLYTLITASQVFGVALPPGMPMWAGILLVVVAYHFVAWPIKSVRHACYYPAPRHAFGGIFGELIGLLIGLFCLGFGVWMLDRHMPEFHEWLVQLPALLQRAAEIVKGWFAQKT